MNLEDLRAVQSRERATNSLQELRDTFYEDAGEYLQELRAERDRAAAEAEDPFSGPEVSRLTDEIEMAEQVLEAIYERRVGKIVKQASLAAAGMGGDESGLTAEEAALYRDLVALIEENKAHVLDVLAGDADGPPPGGDRTGGDDGGADTTPASAGETQGRAGAERAGSEARRPPPEDGPAADPDRESDAEESGDAGGRTDRAPGGTGDGPVADRADPGAGRDFDGSSRGESPNADGGRETAAGGTDQDGEGPDRTTVRITRDVGEILGVDERVYTLEAEDVVALPAANAAPLIEREAAERLE